MKLPGRHYCWILLTGFLLLAIGFALFQIAEQRSTLRWIRESGGDYGTNPGLLSEWLPSRASNWLVSRGWSDPSEDAIHVVLRNTNLSGSDLSRLQCLRSLEILDLRGAKFDDAAVAQLPEFRHLHTLVLGETSLGDAGLENLRELPSLEELPLDHTIVGDSGLVHLAKFKNLRHLNLIGTRTTDAGLEQLQHLSALTTLRLDKTKVSDSGMFLLEPLAQLESLHIGGTEVSEAGRNALKVALPSLRIHPRTRGFFQTEYDSLLQPTENSWISAMPFSPITPGNNQN